MRAARLGILGPNLTMMHVDSTLRDGQSETDAARGRVAGIVHPKERLKNFRQSFGRNAAAIIPHGNRSVACRLMHRDFNIASGRGVPEAAPTLTRMRAMKVSTTAIEGVLILEPKVFGDARGFFMESFNQKVFNEAVGQDVVFLQDNHSRSSKGVMRGLHYQRAPHAQGKLVRVTQGSVFDVAVDIRRGSATFGKWLGVELTGDNHRQMWLAPGIAHGFLVTSESADFLYKTTDYYTPQAEGCVLWSDPALAIAWPDVGRAPSLAAKDAAAPLLSQASPF